MPVVFAATAEFLASGVASMMMADLDLGVGVGAEKVRLGFCDGPGLFNGGNGDVDCEGVFEDVLVAKTALHFLRNSCSSGSKASLSSSLSPLNASRSSKKATFSLNVVSVSISRPLSLPTGKDEDIVLTGGGHGGGLCSHCWTPPTWAICEKRQWCLIVEEGEGKGALFFGEEGAGGIASTARSKRGDQRSAG
jgi:hypothetical protein